MHYPPEIAKPMFGLWYNYCINGARPGTDVEGVSCFPHTDGQNLALMMCVLFIYGKCILFCHSQHSLLTIAQENSIPRKRHGWPFGKLVQLLNSQLEFSSIIHLPCSCTLTSISLARFCLSILHHLLTLCIPDLDRYLVTTNDGAPPKPDNAVRINGVKGRGSIVLFNQASLFQFAEVGLPIGDAQDMGLATDTDNQTYISQMPVFNMQSTTISPVHVLNHIHTNEACIVFYRQYADHDYTIMMCCSSCTRAIIYVLTRVYSILLTHDGNNTSSSDTWHSFQLGIT